MCSGNWENWNKHWSLSIGHNWILIEAMCTIGSYEVFISDKANMKQIFNKYCSISVHITIKITASDLVVESGQITRSFCSIVPGISPMECKEFRICKKKMFCFENFRWMLKTDSFLSQIFSEGWIILIWNYSFFSLSPFSS